MIMMYTKLDTTKTGELYLIRKGWFSHEYELTDKVYTYGKMTYHRLTKRKATAIAATGTWIFQREGLFSRSISITDENGQTMGVLIRNWFSARGILKLDTGFQAEFYRPSIWSHKNIWNSVDDGEIMNFESHPFSLTDTIHLDQSFKQTALIPLLIFLGSYLTILRRRRQARH